MLIILTFLLISLSSFTFLRSCNNHKVYRVVLVYSLTKALILTRSYVNAGHHWKVGKSWVKKIQLPSCSDWPILLLMFVFHRGTLCSLYVKGISKLNKKTRENPLERPYYSFHTTFPAKLQRKEVYLLLNWKATLYSSAVTL